MAWLLALIALCAACRSTGQPTPPSRPAAVDLCEMAAAALRETIKSKAEQPYGLEDACVHRLASVAGRTYVDVRFGDGRGAINASACNRGRYAIRFDARSSQPSPAEGVVLLLFAVEKNGAREFNAMVEEPKWTLRRPEVLAVSPCGSAFGAVRRGPSGWVAKAVPPPRSPDAL